MATTDVDIPGYPFFLQEDPASTTPIYYSAADFRAYTEAFQRRTGILGSDHLKVIQAPTVGFKVNVKAGYANVNGYIVHLPVDTEILMPWAKPTTGSITHKIYIAVYDEYVAGAVNKARLVAVQGSGGGSPPPAGAAATLLLATIDVSSTSPNIQAADITNVAQHGGTSGEYFDLSTVPYLMFGFSPAGSTGGTNNPRAIYNNGFVHLSGRLRRSDSNAFAADTEIYIMNLPSQFMPKYNRYLTGVCSANSGAAGQGMTFRLTIPSNGHITARIPTGYAPLYLTLDGIVYDLD